MRSLFAALPDIQFASDIITCFVALSQFDRKKVVELAHRCVRLASGTTDLDTVQCRSNVAIVDPCFIQPYYLSFFLYRKQWTTQCYTNHNLVSTSSWHLALTFWLLSCMLLREWSLHERKNKSLISELKFFFWDLSHTVFLNRNWSPSIAYFIKAAEQILDMVAFNCHWYITIRWISFVQIVLKSSDNSRRIWYSTFSNPNTEPSCN